MLLRLNAMCNTVFVTQNPVFREDDVSVEILPRDILISMSTKNLHYELPRRETVYHFKLRICRISLHTSPRSVKPTFIFEVFLKV
jgi:hypothetical protein